MNLKKSNDVDLYVGNKIKLKRLEMGFSQTKLAEAVGITFQQIQKYENAKNRVSASKLWEIANILKVDVNFFYDGIDFFKNVASESFVNKNIYDNNTPEFKLLNSKESLQILTYYYALPRPVKNKAYFLLKAMAVENL
jgi:transcriptional regulator with XRE-family HTH domain